MNMNMITCSVLHRVFRLLAEIEDHYLLKLEHGYAQPIRFGQLYTKLLPPTEILKTLLAKDPDGVPRRSSRTGVPPSVPPLEGTSAMYAC